MSEKPVKVIPIYGEPSRFYVLSSSWQCIKCNNLFNGRLKKWSKLRVGSKCPKGCGGTLDVRMHTVDVSELFPVGCCSCEAFDYHVRPGIAKMTEEAREAMDFQDQENARCHHIKRARNEALNKTIKQHNKENGV